MMCGRFVYRKLYKREKNMIKLAGKLLRMKKNEDTFQCKARSMTHGRTKSTSLRNKELRVTWTVGRMM